MVVTLVCSGTLAQLSLHDNLGLNWGPGSPHSLAPRVCYAILARRSICRSEDALELRALLSLPLRDSLRTSRTINQTMFWDPLSMTQGMPSDAARLSHCHSGKALGFLRSSLTATQGKLWTLAHLPRCHPGFVLAPLRAFLAMTRAMTRADLGSCTPPDAPVHLPHCHSGFLPAPLRSSLAMTRADLGPSTPPRVCPFHCPSACALLPRYAPPTVALAVHHPRYAPLLALWLCTNPPVRPSHCRSGSAHPPWYAPLTVALALHTPPGTPLSLALALNTPLGRPSHSLWLCTPPRRAPLTVALALHHPPCTPLPQSLAVLSNPGAPGRSGWPSEFALGFQRASDNDSGVALEQPLLRSGQESCPPSPRAVQEQQTRHRQWGGAGWHGRRRGGGRGEEGGEGEGRSPCEG